LDALREAWSCHFWNNCPMHLVFGVHSFHEVPEEHRDRARMFVKLFDGGHLPWSLAEPLIMCRGR